MVAAAVGAAAVAGSIYSANKQEDAINDASRTQAASTDAGIQFQREALNQQRSDLAPFRNLAFSDYASAPSRPQNVLSPANHFLAPSGRPQALSSSFGLQPKYTSKGDSKPTALRPGVSSMTPLPQTQTDGGNRVTSSSPISALKAMAVNREQYAYSPQNDSLLNNALSRTVRSVMDAQAAQGKLGSGSTLTSLVESMAPIYMNRQQQMFDQNYNANNQQFNQLQSIVGMAQNAAAGQGTATQGTANNITNLMTNNANAQAAAGIAQANNQANMLNNLMGAGMMAYGMYNRGGAA